METQTDAATLEDAGPPSPARSLPPRPAKERLGRMRYVLYWSVGTALTLVGYYLTRVLRSTDIID